MPLTRSHVRDAPGTLPDGVRLHMWRVPAYKQVCYEVRITDGLFDGLDTCYPSLRPSFPATLDVWHTSNGLDRSFAVMRQLGLLVSRPACAHELLQQAWVKDTMWHRDGLQRLPSPTSSPRFFINQLTKDELALLRATPGARR
jgi:hypothetical protein